MPGQRVALPKAQGLLKIQIAPPPFRACICEEVQGWRRKSVSALSKVGGRHSHTPGLARLSGDSKIRWSEEPLTWDHWLVRSTSSSWGTSFSMEAIRPRSDCHLFAEEILQKHSLLWGISTWGSSRLRGVQSFAGHIPIAHKDEVLRWA